MTDGFDTDWFKDRSTVNDDGCWVWDGALTQGYGWVHRKAFHGGAHRLAYLSLVGPIPEGRQIDHLCRNRACVNPGHLEIVTQRENVLRGEAPTAGNATKAACPKGHPYSAENTWIDGRGSRVCKTCERLRSREKARRRRERLGQKPRTHLWLDDDVVRQDAKDFIAGGEPLGD